LITKLPHECLDQIAQAAAVLHPADRDSFVHAAIARLRFEIGPGTANRVIRELLATAAYRRAGNVAAGPGRPRPHRGRPRPHRGRHGKPVKDTDDAA
jgi:hypothetical protein